MLIRLRQHVRGVLYKSPGRCLLEAPLYSGRAPSGMGSAQLRSLRAAHLPGRLNQGADMLSRSNVPSEEWMLHPQVVQKIWKTFGKAEVDLFASKDNSHCPTYYSKDRDALAHDWPNLLLYAFPPIALLPQVARRVRADSATDSSPLARAPETGSPLSGERNNMAPSTRAVGSLPLAAQREPTGLPERVLNTILRLEPRLRDAFTPLSGLFSPLGASTVVKTPLPLN